MEVTVIVSLITFTALYTTHSTYTTPPARQSDALPTELTGRQLWTYVNICLEQYGEMDWQHENLRVMQMLLSFPVQNVWDTVQYYNSIEVTMFDLGPTVQ